MSEKDRLDEKYKISSFEPKKDNIWIFDTETFTKESEYFKKHGNVTSGLIYGESVWSDEVFKGVTPQDLKDFLINTTKRKKSIKIGFHNLKFDMSYFIKHFAYDLEIVYFNEKTEDRNKKVKIKEGQFTNFVNNFGQVYYYKMKFRGCKYTVTFIDTLKILIKSVGALAEFTPYEKFEELDIDTLPEVEKFDDAPDEWKKRIINDVKIVTHMWRHYKSSPLPNGLTAASIAMSDLKKEIGLRWSTHYGTIADYETWLEFKDSYKGGAVIVNDKFRNRPVKLFGKNLGKMEDIKSSYPSQCVNYNQPYGLPTFKTDDTLQLFKIKISSIRLKKNKIPVLQVENNKVCSRKDIITNTDIEFTITIWEKEFNLMKEVYDIKYELVKEYSFNADKTISKWFEKMFDIRKYFGLIGNRAMEEIYKILINSATGKFGQNPYTQIKRLKIEVDGDLTDDEKHTKCNNVTHFTNRRVRYDTASGKVHECIDSELSTTFSYVPLVSHITSGARIQLFEYINYKDNPKYFVYSDTDSVIFTHANRVELPPHHRQGNELGNWASELHNINYISVIREKGYRVIGVNSKTNKKYIKTRMSGLPQKIADKISNDNFKLGYKTTVLKQEKTENGIILVEHPFEIKDIYRKRGI